MAVASLVLGILSLIIGPLSAGVGGIAFGLLALIFGLLGRKRAAAENTPTGLSTAGIVLGVLGIVLGISLFAACSVLVRKAAVEVEKEAEHDPELRWQLEKSGFPLKPRPQVASPRDGDTDL